VHGARYADYSHGVRLVSAMAYVDGAARPLLDLLEDPRLARLVSDEGPISRAVLRAAGAHGRLQLSELRRSAGVERPQRVSSVLQQRKPR
jgi:hypothetical protein